MSNMITAATIEEVRQGGVQLDVLYEIVAKIVGAVKFSESHMILTLLDGTDRFNARYFCFSKEHNTDPDLYEDPYRWIKFHGVMRSEGFQVLCAHEVNNNSKAPSATPKMLANPCVSLEEQLLAMAIED